MLPYYNNVELSHHSCFQELEISTSNKYKHLIYKLARILKTKRNKPHNKPMLSNKQIMDDSKGMLTVWNMSFNMDKNSWMNLLH
jgi:hypothetical protein